MLLGFYGRSNSGKTTLVEGLVKRFSPMYSVIAIKHIGRENVELDTEGKDTWRFGKAGAMLTVASTNAETQLTFKHEMPLSQILQLIDAELVLVEGFKREDIPKVAVGDIETLPNTLFRYPGDEEAIVEFIETGLMVERIQAALGGTDCGECGENSCRELAEKVASGERRVEDCVRLDAEKDLVLVVDGKEIPLSKFPARLLRNTLMGVVTSLKGGEDASEVEIRMKRNK